MLPAGISGWTIDQAYAHCVQRNLHEAIEDFVKTVEKTLSSAKLDEKNPYVHIYYNLWDYSDYVRLEVARIINQEYGSKCLFEMNHGYFDYDPEVIPIGIRVTYTFHSK